MKLAQGFAQIIIVALIVFALGVSSIYFFQKYIQSKEKVGDETPTIPVKQDPTTNWKTYTDTAFGFSIKYPAEILEPHTGPMWTEKGVIFKNFGSESKSVSIYIGPSTMEQQEAFDFFRNAKDGLVVLPQNIVDVLHNMYGTKTLKTNLIISDSPAIELITDRLGVGGDRWGINNYVVGVFIVKGGTLWEVSAHFLASSDRKDFMKTFDQILSTFKFTN